MANKGGLAAAGLVVAALLGAALWWALGEGGGADAPDTGGGAEPTAAQPAEEKAAEPRRRAGAGRPWVALGAGSVVGVVHEYGTERPLAGLEVSLTAGAPGPDRTLTATTRADGSFLFDDVPNFDDWMLRVAAQKPLADVELAGVGVVENQQTSLGVVYVSPGFSVPGIVVDERGAPIAGAEVRALRSRTGGSQMDILRLIRDLPTETPAVDKATSGDDGRFRLTKTPPGTYDVKIVARGRQVGVEKGVIVTPDAERRELRFVLGKGFEVAGRVLRKGPGPVEGIGVVAFRQPRGEGDFVVVDRVFATTDKDGAYRLDGLGGGQYIVAATPAGEPFAIVDDVQVPTRAAVDIVLEGDSYLEGRVTGAAGKPVDGAQVYVAKFDRNPVVGTARTDADGRYSIRGLKSGTFEMFLVQAEGYGTWPQDLMAMLMGGGGGNALTLEPGRNVKDVALAAGGVVRGVVRVQGTEEPISGVRVELFSPLAMFGGGRMTTTDAEGKFELTSVSIGETVVLATKDGWFQPGVNSMSLGMMLAGSRRSKPGPDTGRGPKVSITDPGQTVERVLELARGSTVVGQVVTPAGEPVAGARVDLVAEERGGGMMSALSSMFSTGEARLTDAEGRFEMPGPAPGQKVHVRARAQGWLDGRGDDFSAKPGERAEGHVVRLLQGATIEGRVTDGEGRALEGALVRWIAKPEQDWGVQWQLRNADPVVTDAEGRYRAANVATGPIVVHFTHERSLPFTRSDLVAEEGKPLAIDARLEAGRAISGKVLGPSGTPVAGARVTLTPKDDDSSVERDPYADTPDATTDAQGAFRVEGLYSSRYRVQAESKGHAPSEAADVAGGESVTLRLQPALRVAGHVRVQGTPTANVRVQLMRAADTSEVGGTVRSDRTEVGEARTDAQGRFQIDDVPGGTYELDVGPGWGDRRANIVAKTVKDVIAGTENLIVEADAGMVIAGTVQLESGDPAPAGWVNCWQVAADGGNVENRSTGWAQLDGGAFEIVGR